MADSIQFANVPVALSKATVKIGDFFGTGNDFYGGQLGLEGEIHLGKRLFLDVWGKAAFGTNAQRVLIGGDTIIIAPPTPVGNKVLQGGIFAQSTNIGTYTQTQFAVIPEVGAKFGVRITDNLRFSAGYEFLFINRVVRPGDEINPQINPTRIPFLLQKPAGAAQPAFIFQVDDLRAHAVSFELEYRF
jgi:hypothetical protein